MEWTASPAAPACSRSSRSPSSPPPVTTTGSSCSVPRRTAREGMLFSPLLESVGVVAGFTTRAQGSMAGSVYPLDEQARNRERLAQRLGFSEIARVKQVHRNAVAHISHAVDPWPVADALWTERPGLLLGIAAADCVPI